MENTAQADVIEIAKPRIEELATKRIRKAIRNRT